MFNVIATSPVVEVSNCLWFTIFLPGHYPTIPFVPRATGCSKLLGAGFISCGFEYAFRLTAYETTNFLTNFPTHGVEWAFLRGVVNIWVRPYFINTTLHLFKLGSLTHYMPERTSVLTFTVDIKESWDNSLYWELGNAVLAECCAIYLIRHQNQRFFIHKQWSGIENQLFLPSVLHSVSEIVGLA